MNQHEGEMGQHEGQMGQYQGQMGQLEGQMNIVSKWQFPITLLPLFCPGGSLPNDNFHRWPLADK